MTRESEPRLTLIFESEYADFDVRRDDKRGDDVRGDKESSWDDIYHINGANKRPIIPLTAEGN